VDLYIAGGGQAVSRLACGLEEVQSAWDGLAEGCWLWVDVNGLGDVGLISGLGNLFGIHRLVMEDVLHLHQRPKTERYENIRFTVLQVPHLREEGLDYEQVSVLSGEQFLISFQSQPVSCLERVASRVMQQTPRFVNSRADYLFYAVLDGLVDHVFPVLEALDEDVERLEQRIFNGEGRPVLERIHEIRTQAVGLRRILYYQAMVPAELVGAEVEGISEATRPYLRDVLDHAECALGRSDHLKDSCLGLFDLQNSLSGAQLNEVMKVLTVISTVFIPLTFIVGVYGMNFDPEASTLNMPELHWRFGYLYVWGLMMGSVLIMLWLFRRKGWIGHSNRRGK